jgi:hypothetical protein
LEGSTSDKARGCATYIKKNSIHDLIPHPSPPRENSSISKAFSDISGGKGGVPGRGQSIPNGRSSHGGSVHGLGGTLHGLVPPTIIEDEEDEDIAASPIITKTLVAPGIPSSSSSKPTGNELTKQESLGPELTGQDSFDISEISGSHDFSVSGHGLSGNGLSSHGKTKSNIPRLRSISFHSDYEEKGDGVMADNPYFEYGNDQYLAHDDPSPYIPNMISMNKKHRLLLKSGIEIRSYILSTSFEGTTKQLIERSNPILTAPVPYDPNVDLVAEDLRVTPAIISAIDR